MPVVPFSRQEAPAPAGPDIDEKYFVMAAAEMHKLGRLFEPTVPVDPKHFESGDLEAVEKSVDSFIKDKEMNKGERFNIEHPEGPRSYEYLGPNSGGRKDWREIKTKPEVPMS